MSHINKFKCRKPHSKIKHRTKNFDKTKQNLQKNSSLFSQVKCDRRKIWLSRYTAINSASLYSFSDHSCTKEGTGV